MLDGAGEGRLGLLGAVVDEARGQEQRLGGFAVRLTMDAAMDQAGGGAERWRDRWSSCHGALA